MGLHSLTQSAHLIDVLSAQSRSVRNVHQLEQASNVLMAQVCGDFTPQVFQSGGLLDDEALQLLANEPFSDRPLIPEISIGSVHPVLPSEPVLGQNKTTLFHPSQGEVNRSLACTEENKQRVNRLLDTCDITQSPLPQAEKNRAVKSTSAMANDYPLVADPKDNMQRYHHHSGAENLTARVARLSAATSQGVKRNDQDQNVRPLTTDAKVTRQEITSAGGNVPPQKGSLNLGESTPGGPVEKGQQRWRETVFGNAWNTPVLAAKMALSTTTNTVKLERCDNLGRAAFNAVNIQSQLTQTVNRCASQSLIATTGRQGAEVANVQAIAKVSSKTLMAGDSGGAMHRSSEQKSTQSSIHGTGFTASNRLVGLKGLAARATKNQTDGSDIIGTVSSDTENLAQFHAKPLSNSSAAAPSGGVNVGELTRLITQEARRAGIDLETFQP